MKKWIVKCECNLCAENIQMVRVKANTERKASRIAKGKLKKMGYRNVKVLKVVDVTDGKIVNLFLAKV